MLIKQLSRYKHSFLLQSTYNVPEFKLKAHTYAHPSNAKLIHLETDDQNQTFATIFRSEPNSDKGTPHVLEHLMCCGSEKYPVRDPFMAMIRRSLNTYLNAWTGPDYICFPLASLNQQDFTNLQTVVLDLVFKPILSELDFRQEGHRLDIVDKQLVYKGIVYNEMKGYMQNADYVFGQYLQHYLLQNTIYSFNSGGDPTQIPKLTYAELKEHYSNTFKPSKAIFYQYGKYEPNFNLIESYLHKQSEDYSINLTQPQPKEIPEVLDLPFQGELSCMLSYTYLLNSEDYIQQLALLVINHVLFENQSGLLYHLIEEGLADSFARANGMEQFGNNILYNIAFQGVAQDRKNVQQIQSKVQSVLQKLTKQFPKDKVEAALHQLEAQSKMPSCEQGMKLLQNLIQPLINDKNYLDYLYIDKAIQELKNKIANERYLEEIIEKQFIKPYIFYGQPNENYLSNILQQEKNSLQQITINEKEIVELNSKLDNQQESDFSILPTITIDDVKNEIEKTQFDESQIEGVKIYESIQSTNGITFFKFKFQLGYISDAARQYLDIYCNFFNKFGTQTHTHQEMSQLFSQHSLGLEISYETADQVGTYIMFQLSCLNTKISEALKVFQELLLDPVFRDTKHLSTLLRNQKTHLQNAIVEEQLSYATQLANSKISYPYYVGDINFATKFQLQYAQHFLQADGMKKGFYIDDFDFQMHEFLYSSLNRDRMSVIIHQDGNANYKKQLEELIQGIKQKYQTFNINFGQGDYELFQPQFNNYATLIQSQINCCSRAYQIPYFTHPDLPAIQVMADYLSNNQLHREIREKGGAYGAGCSVRSFKGVLNMWSYQDPNIMKTFNIFDQLNLNVNQERLNEAKLTVFQRLDSPIEPYYKGVEQLVLGYNYEQFEKMRLAVKNVDKSDVERVFDKYIKQQNFSQGVIASEEHEDIKKLKNEDWNISSFTK